MEAVDQLNSFFSKASTKTNYNETYANIVYILVELGWTQKDIEETDIPFIFLYVSKRLEVIKEQEKQSKKTTRR
jgi:hypothetical protein